MRYTNDDLKKAVSMSKNWREVCEFVGANPISGSQYNFRNRCRKIGIDFSHFKGKSFERMTQVGYKNAIEYINSGSIVKSHNLKLKLIKDGILSEVCNICSISEWCGKPVVWELDHIDRDHFNNQINNLQILCPNCHSRKTREDRE